MNFAQLLSEGALVALAQVILIDLVLAGDNAVIIGMAAARVPADQRKTVIFWGLAAAVITRVGMAIITVQLLKIIGLTLAGGLLLLWVCWRMWRDIRASGASDKSADASSVSVLDRKKMMRAAIFQIALADISMSLDNVLAVAGAAREHVEVLVIGLLLSIALMGFAANIVARLLHRYSWISYVGLAIVLYVAGSMIVRGSQDVLAAL